MFIWKKKIITINAGADGLDANGNIVISGGNLEIWGAKSGSDGDFIDISGTLTINGGTIFAGGNAGMINPNNWQNSQNKINGQNSVKENQVINIMSGTNIIKSYTAPKAIAYLYYTSAEVDSNYKFSISNSSENTNNKEDNSNSQGINDSIEGGSADSIEGKSTGGEFTKISIRILIMISICILIL